MRCGRCGKNFDEELYSGVCFHCGHFNNRQAEVDVSEYISARFGDEENVSANVRAANQHAKLHEMYDTHNAHKAGAGQHEKLHGAYDKADPHRNQGKRDSYSKGRNDRYQGKKDQTETDKKIRRAILTAVVVFALIVSIFLGGFGMVVLIVGVAMYFRRKSKGLNGTDMRKKWEGKGGSNGTRI